MTCNNNSKTYYNHLPLSKNNVILLIKNIIKNIKHTKTITINHNHNTINLTTIY